MEFWIISLLLLLNALLAMSEIALLSARKSRLEERAVQGSANAEKALLLAKDPDQFLSAIQIGITIIGVSLGVYSGIVLTGDVRLLLLEIEALKNQAMLWAIIIVINGIAYLLLLFGHLLPKTIALNHPEHIAIVFAGFMRLFALVLYPAVAFLRVSTKLLLKVLFITPNQEPPVTEEELKGMIEKGSQYGVLEKQESEMIRSIFRFSDRKAYSVMTPRKDVIWVNINSDIEILKNTIFNSGHTKFLVCDNSIDNILGIMDVKDFLFQLQYNQKINLKEITVEPTFIPESMPALRVLELFREKGIRLGIVVDEYGTTEGIITLHDLVENIVGELPHIGEKDEEMVYQREDGSLLIDGSMQIDELKEILHFRNELPGESKGYYSTLGGFIMYQLDKIPETGDTFKLEKYKFEIVDMDVNRVDKVLVHEIDEPHEEE